MKSLVLWLKIALKTAIYSLKFIKTTNRPVLKKWALEILQMSSVEVNCSGRFPECPFIIMANHESYFDIFALLYCCDFNLIWFAKKELFKIPIFGKALRKSNAIAVDRKNSRRASFAILRALKKKKDSDVIVIFPQGTRKNRNIFKDGGILIAKKKNIPIVPVKISGSNSVLPYGLRKIKSGKIVVNIYDKIDVEGKTASELEETVREKIL